MKLDAATIERMVREVLNTVQNNVPPRPALSEPASEATKKPSNEMVVPLHGTGCVHGTGRAKIDSPISSAKPASGSPSVNILTAAGRNEHFDSEPALPVPESSPAKALANGPNSPDTSPPRIAPVWIKETVVTAEVLRLRRQGQSPFVVGQKAIVTPSAMDFLRSEKLNWERGTSESTATSDSAVGGGSWKFFLSFAGSNGLQAVQAVRQNHPRVRFDVVGGMREAIPMAATALSRAEVPGIVILTNEPEIVVCRANRQAAIRAAVVRDLADWNKIRPYLRPNLVCIDPATRMFMELRTLLTKIVTDPLPEIPEGWVE